MIYEHLRYTNMIRNFLHAVQYIYYDSYRVSFILTTMHIITKWDRIYKTILVFINGTESIRLY